mmetsp:Transcript_18549/g.42055  ORF Transcript_18549/g.42055 Transcript_18549/m.42055 type:complete len:319 (+) Transcript_18549:810-1766(+)
MRHHFVSAEVVRLVETSHEGRPLGHLRIVLPGLVPPLLVVEELLVWRLDLEGLEVRERLLGLAVVDELRQDDEVRRLKGDVGEVPLGDAKGQGRLQQAQSVDLHAVLLEHGRRVGPVRPSGTFHRVGELHEKLCVQIGVRLLVLHDDQGLVGGPAATKLLRAHDLQDAVVVRHGVGRMERLCQPLRAVLGGGELLPGVWELHPKALSRHVFHVVLLELLHGDPWPPVTALGPLRLAALLRWVWAGQPLLHGAAHNDRGVGLGRLVGPHHQVLAGELDAHPALRGASASEDLVVEPAVGVEKLDLLDQRASGQAVGDLP